MINILLVDDVDDNNLALELIIEMYMEDNGIDEDDYTVDISTNGRDALIKVQDASYDMIFLDVMMPKMNGLDALKYIRGSKLDKQPVIIMVTALGDDETKRQERKRGANAFIVKPFQNDTIELMLNHYIKKIEKININNKEFDLKDDLFDFNNDGTIKVDNILVKISAKEFLDDSGDIEYILDSIDDCEPIMEVIENLEIDEFSNNKENITFLLSKYGTFLNNFADFYDISSLLHLLKENINKIEIDNYSEPTSLDILELTKEILLELRDWKINVFDDKDSIDVFSINDSILTKCISIQNIINLSNNKI